MNDRSPHDSAPHPAPTADLSRRDFVALPVALGLVGAGAPAWSAALPVVESDVSIKTPDGSCDAAFIHPASGKYPGVLIWTEPGHGQNPNGLGEHIQVTAPPGEYTLVVHDEDASGEHPEGLWQDTKQVIVR